MFSLGGTVLRKDLAGVVEEAFLQSSLYIGPKVMPPMEVPAQQGQYPVIRKGTGNLLRNEVKVRGYGGNYARINRAWEADNYNCAEYGLEAIVDDSQARVVSRFFDLESFEVRRNLGQVQLAHEVRVAAKIFAPATFNLTTSATAYTSANLATFDIGADIDTTKQQIQQRGENVDNLTVVMSLNNFLRARQSTRLQNRIRGTISTDSQLTLDAQSMADALQVKQILIGRAMYDQSNQGATVSLAAIWSDTYCWVGNCMEPTGPEQYFNGGVGFTLYWGEDADIFQVESYREENIRSEVIRGRQNTDEKIVLSAGGQLLVTQYT